MLLFVFSFTFIRLNRYYVFGCFLDFLRQALPSSSHHVQWTTVGLLTWATATGPINISPSAGSYSAFIVRCLLATIGSPAQIVPWKRWSDKMCEGKKGKIIEWWIICGRGGWTKGAGCVCINVAFPGDPNICKFSIPPPTHPTHSFTTYSCYKYLLNLLVIQAHCAYTWISIRLLSPLLIFNSNLELCLSSDLTYARVIITQTACV